MKILAFTGNRADYYLQLPLLRKFNNLKEFDLKLIITGSILGKTDNTVINNIQKEGFNIESEIVIEEFPENHTDVIPKIITECSKLIKNYKPDLCIVYGDRYESFGFSIASFHFSIPTLHIEAGDITNGGTYDDNVRHSITKMSHLFCTSTKKGLSILKSLGEEPWRAIHSGLLSYEDMYLKNDISKIEVLNDLQIDDNPIIICTMHPIPGKLNQTLKDTAELFDALKKLSQNKKVNIIFTAPNNDRGSKSISELIQNQMKFIIGGKFINSLGGERFQSLLSLAKKRPIILCGNSSAVIKEAPFFGAHGLNIGQRQLGRDSADSQVNVDGDSFKILNSLEKMIINKCTVKNNPYLVENSSEVIINFIRKIFYLKSKEEIIFKKWYEK